MGEDVIDRERKPVIFNLFPVNKKYVLTAFENLDPRDNSSGVRATVEEESLILEKTNPHAFASFENLITDYYTEDNEVKMRWGILICYRALRLKAISQKGTLPRLTQQFVQDYDDKQNEIAEEKAADKPSQSLTQTGLKTRRERIFKFRNLEPEFSQIVEEKLGAGSDWVPEKDYIYLGIMDAYFLFREGLSSPKNFQENP